MLNIKFPVASGIRVLMMPFIQGDAKSVPAVIAKKYGEIIEQCTIEKGEIGYITIDESMTHAGKAHRAQGASFSRAIHTEAGIRDFTAVWGGGGWGSTVNVTLERDTKMLLANNIDSSCAVWDATHADTSYNGDLGDKAALYPLEDAVLLKAGEVHQIGIFTPHESLPIERPTMRQFLRIIGKGVHGREPYFTLNPLM